MPRDRDIAPSQSDAEPIDLDVEREDLGPSPLAQETRTLIMVSVGGVIGALARYRAEVHWPTPAGAFPATTFTINLVGSLLLGALLGVLEVRPSWAQWRPLLGTGLIGGFTTFSTFAVDNQHLLRDGHTATALTYTALTLIVCAVAALAGDYLAHGVHHLAARSPR